jgi:hypothetical protein
MSDPHDLYPDIILKCGKSGMSEPLKFPLQVFCNRNAHRNILITALIGALTFFGEWMRVGHCPGCDIRINILVMIVFAAGPFVLCCILFRDQPAKIIIFQDSLSIHPLRIFGFIKSSKTTRYMSEFSYLTFKPVLGGAAGAVMAGGAVRTVGNKKVVRFVLRGKPGFSDVCFDLPDGVMAESFEKEMPMFRDYWQRLAAALNLPVRDEIWNSGLSDP